MPVLNTIADRHDEMTAWRHALHAHPELGFEEHWTSDFIAEKLASFGVEVHRGMAGTGVVGIIRGQGDSGKMIGLRADIDALPMQEDNAFDHKSTIDGRMHACGHDGHTTMLLGAAQYLAETRNFDGAVALIFQPAEEGGGGGKVMIDDGLFTEFDVDTVWGMHNWPGVDVGKAVVQRGPSMAAADVFRITITGKGGHAAMPHSTVDTIPAGAAVVNALQTIVSRQVDPLDPAVVSVTQFHAGTTHNVISDTAEIEGTARYVRHETGAFIHDRIKHIAMTVAQAHGCTASFAWEPGYPPTINHPEEANRAAAIVEQVMGPSSVIFDAPPSMASEDFSYMLEQKPGAYIWLGAGEGKLGCMLHNTGYDFNDELLPVGASFWVNLVESELPR
ncbi:MAG: amidohydrolase [Alphaproteobacteria bacterium]|nr:amidohydrolase [Alphaproteobacteria bacterium]